MNANPNEPELTAVVRADGTGQITFDGSTSPVYAGSVADIRATIIGRAIAIATERGEAVHIAIADLDGLYPLRVDPNGNVETTGAVTPLEERADASASADSARHDTDRAKQSDVPESQAAVIPPPPDGIALFDAAFDAAPAPAPAPSPAAPTPVRAVGSPADRASTAPFPGDPNAGAHVPSAYFRRSTELEVDAHTEPQASVSAQREQTPSVSPTPSTAEKDSPTLDDFLQSRPDAPVGPAKNGWQGLIRRATGGLISPRPGKSELAHRSAVERVQRSLKGPRTIVVLNPKGGAHKTTATLLLAATFGIHRGGSTLAWDNNETRGTLGWRAQPSRHTNTAVDLLHDLDRFSDVRSARVGDLDNYVRAQGDAQFDVLASDEDAAASSTIDASAFRNLHSTLSRFYRVLVIDTGNNMRASNWEAAVEAADQLVVVTTVNEETAASAAWLLDGLRQKGHQDKVAQAVTILSSPGDAPQPDLSRRLHEHFAALTRTVLEVPYDPGFQSGGPLNVDVLSPKTREAWLQVSAAVADGL
ncbi:MinD-like ATPase involved in chromosome partitioning or flagellar assembly [Okibacterium sp. HSC-33S16]|uniref:MinD/ParA family ATP-binding protein n=1 Tax=Okibacterium sp. HSC-33S16 TaxID=2910965 RepID=UPI00209D859C|nr:chromosome partitioning protein [Okibacterium sp. HSC-33S16]MCP2031328.1 MinD-like ATPase involved in chromosome partitioning or flagellar assembly [Okibacterium sp. HSC-33S16]